MSGIEIIVMRPTLLVLGTGILLCLLLSCSKDKMNGPGKKVTSIKGSWELRALVGGQIPGTPGVLQPGNGYIWTFADTTYTFFAHNQLYEQGVYTIIRDTFPQTGQLEDKLILNADYTQGLYFEFSADTLVIYRGTIASDGSIEKYVQL